MIEFNSRRYIVPADVKGLVSINFNSFSDEQ